MLKSQYVLLLYYSNEISRIISLLIAYKIKVTTLILVIILLYHFLKFNILFV